MSRKWDGKSFICVNRSCEYNSYVSSKCHFDLFVGMGYSFGPYLPTIHRPAPSIQPPLYCRRMVRPSVAVILSLCCDTTSTVGGTYRVSKQSSRYTAAAAVFIRVRGIHGDGPIILLYAGCWNHSHEAIAGPLSIGLYIAVPDRGLQGVAQFCVSRCHNLKFSKLSLGSSSRLVGIILCDASSNLSP